jgi:septum formation protein
MLLDKLKNYTLVLASQSPRRRELLAGLGLTFEVNWIETNETLSVDLMPCQMVEQLARQKAEIVANQYDLTKSIVIGGDTIVCIDNVILGKPTDRQDAIQMLQHLSGRKHLVISGLCVIHNGQTLCNHDVTEVYVKPLTTEEILFYVDLYRPFDKAGGYGIQEWFGYQSVSRINGSFYNVMGLPTHLLWEMLCKVVK